MFSVYNIIQLQLSLWREMKKIHLKKKWTNPRWLATTFKSIDRWISLFSLLAIPPGDFGPEIPHRYATWSRATTAAPLHDVNQSLTFLPLRSCVRSLFPRLQSCSIWHHLSIKSKSLFQTLVINPRGMSTENSQRLVNHAAVRRMIYKLLECPPNIPSPSRSLL